MMNFAKYFVSLCFGLILFLSSVSTKLTLAETTNIGALAELTGNFSRFGEDCRRGYEIAREHSTSSANVIFGDNQSDAKVGISEFRRLVDLEHASAVVTTRSPVGLALNPLSAQQKIPLIGVVGHPRFVAENPFAVRVFPSASDEAQTLAAYVIAKNEARIAVVSMEDEYFLGLKNEFEAKVGTNKIVFSETVAPTEQDFGTLLLRMKSKSPTAILANVGPGQLIQFIRKAKDAKIPAHLYSNFLVGSTDIRQALGEYGNGVVFAELDYEKPNFLNAVTKTSGVSDVSPIGYSCYVALTYALELERTASAKNISMTHASTYISDLPTLDGQISFVAREAKFTVLPKTIRDGVVVKLELGSN